MENVIECPSCGRELDKDKVIKHKYVCYECGYYFRVRTNNRIKMVADRGSFEQWFEDLVESNPLKFEGYEEKLKLRNLNNRGEHLGITSEYEKSQILKEVADTDCCNKYSQGCCLS